MDDITSPAIKEVRAQLAANARDYKIAEECQCELTNLEQRLADKRRYLVQLTAEIDGLATRIDNLRAFKQTGKTIQSVRQERLALSEKLGRLIQIETERQQSQKYVTVQRCRAYCIEHSLATNTALNVMTFDEIIYTAYSHHNRTLLLGKSFRVTHDDVVGGEGDGNCLWDYGSNGCHCGYGHYAWNVDRDDLLTQHTLDSSDPVGCVVAD